MTALPADFGMDQACGESHSEAVCPDPSAPGTMTGAIPHRTTSRVQDALLLIYADAVDDLEKVRIATANRVRALRQAKNMDDTPEERTMVALAEQIAAIEHGAILALKRAMKQHPLGPWVKATIGVGEKQAARLLAAIGDPYWHHAADRPRRGPAELWAYCGFHVLLPGQLQYAHHSPFAGEHPVHVAQDEYDTHIPLGGVAPRRQKGKKANWNNVARSRARLIAESCIKHAHSPYRSVYDAGRAKYAEAEISDMQKHNRALRLVAKAILRDLYLEAKRIHLEAE